MATGKDDADATPPSPDVARSAHQALILAATKLVLTARPLATVPQELRPHLSSLEHALFACSWEESLDEPDPPPPEPPRPHLHIVD